MLLSLLFAATQAVAAPPLPSWIWIEGEGPPTWAPAEARYFRREFTVEAVPATALLRITADDAFTAYLNGERVGEGDSWSLVYDLDVTALLRPGRNVLAVEARSTLRGPGGVVARLEGLPEALVTDAQFRVSREGPEGWEQPDFDDSAWAPVLVMGVVGMPPWGSAVSDQFTSSDVIERIVATYRPDDPVLVVPTPRGSLGTVRDVALGGGAPPTVAVVGEGVPGDAWAVELLGRGLAALGCGTSETSPGPGIVLELQPDAAIEEQGYELSITPGNAVLLRASSLTGLGYGAATLVQLLRVRDGQLVAPEAQLEDAPPCEFRGPVVAPCTLQWLDFCAFFKMNAWFSGAQGAAPIVRQANRRGIRLMLARHLPDEYDFQSAEALDELAAWALKAADDGYHWVTINADDRPSVLFTPADLEHYGPGFAGLGKAHADFLNRLKAKLAGRIEIIFCPRVYYQVADTDTSEGAEDQRAYLRNIGAGLDAPLTVWVTQVTPAFLREAAARYKTPPLAWHNFFPGDTTDWKVYYEAYPVVGDPGSARGFWVLGNTQADTLWQANYVTFAGNTWNPGQPVGLREAFTALYGVEAGEALTRWAVLTGGHDRPIGIMADLWDQPPEVATRFVGSGWCGIVPTAKPTPELLKQCRKLSAGASEAAQMDLAGAGVPEDMAARLKTEARRTHLAFALWAHKLAAQLGVPDDTADLEAQKAELGAILDSLQLDASATDRQLTQ
jgi:hypothetical protein